MKKYLAPGYKEEGRSSKWLTTWGGSSEQRGEGADCRAYQAILP